MEATDDFVNETDTSSFDRRSAPVQQRTDLDSVYGRKASGRGHVDEGRGVPTKKRVHVDESRNTFSDEDDEDAIHELPTPPPPEDPQRKDMRMMGARLNQLDQKIANMQKNLAQSIQSNREAISSEMEDQGIANSVLIIIFVAVLLFVGFTFMERLFIRYFGAVILQIEKSRQSILAKFPDPVVEEDGEDEAHSEHSE